MKSPVKHKKSVIRIDDLYAVNIGSIWNSVKQEHISFWAITAYFFFEYVRPQSAYPSLDIVPWAQLTLLVALIGAFSDRTVKWVQCVENKHFVFLFFNCSVVQSVCI